MENYTKLRIIGSGSFGTVWLIRSKSNQRNYVLKEIPLCTVQEKEREFVLNEVQVLSRLKHKNIIRYKEAFLTDGLLCISMEFANDGDLSNKIQKQCGRMFLKEQVIDWFIQLCLAVKYIHGMNILHRDIKSQNIFLAKGNVIKLGDFGIARVLHNTLDHAMTIVGTPYYLSPEICQSQPYNHKSDIWALGCVLYEMITLRHPFEATDFAGLVLNILHADYAPIPESHGPLLRDLVTVLLRVKPTERPSAKQILHIPAMQPHTDKILVRGRAQRSESVSYATKEMPRGRRVWRKPDLMSTENAQSCVPGEADVMSVADKRRRSVKPRNDGDNASHIEEEIWVSPQQVRSCDEACHIQESRGGSGHREVRSQRKRACSEVFCSDNECNELIEEEPASSCKSTYKEKFGVGDVLDKENLNPFEVQWVYVKQRAYSTSIVRESVERKPLMPLNVKHTVLPFSETYDVLPQCARQIREETYTKKTEKILEKHLPNIYCENEAKSQQKESTVEQFPKLLHCSDDQKQKDFIKILLCTRNRFNFGNISPLESMSSYTQTMRSFLERTLGREMFIAVYRYLTTDVEKDDAIGITSKLFKTMGEENIIYIPLVLQLIQCESSFL